MTDAIPSLLNLYVYDVYEPWTFQRHFPLCPRIWKIFSDTLQASICRPIWLEGQLFVKLLSCELLVFRNSVKAESVFLHFEKIIYLAKIHVRKNLMDMCIPDHPDVSTNHAENERGWLDQTWWPLCQVEYHPRCNLNSFSSKFAMPNLNASSESPRNSVRCFLTAATLDCFARSNVTLLLCLSKAESSPLL